MNDISLLKTQLHLLPISKNLEEARNKFNSLLPYIGEKRRFYTSSVFISQGKSLNRQ